MADSLIAPRAAAHHLGLACRLRRRLTGKAVSPTSGEVELENTSSEVLEVKVQSTFLEHLDLVVTDSAGRIVSDSCYGDLFLSPLPEPYFFHLKPGEKFTANVSLLGNVSREQHVPGAYRVQAIFEYNGLRAVSEPLDLRI